jgi:hypothetical protein
VRKRERERRKIKGGKEKNIRKKVGKKLKAIVVWKDK